MVEYTLSIENGNRVDWHLHLARASGETLEGFMSVSLLLFSVGLFSLLFLFLLFSFLFLLYSSIFTCSAVQCRLLYYTSYPDFNYTTFTLQFNSIQFNIIDIYTDRDISFHPPQSSVTQASLHFQRIADSSRP